MKRFGIQAALSLSSIILLSLTYSTNLYLTQLLILTTEAATTKLWRFLSNEFTHRNTTPIFKEVRSENLALIHLPQL